MWTRSRLLPACGSEVHSQIRLTLTPKGRTWASSCHSTCSYAGLLVEATAYQLMSLGTLPAVPHSSINIWGEGPHHAEPSPLGPKVSCLCTVYYQVFQELLGLLSISSPPWDSRPIHETRLGDKTLLSLPLPSPLASSRIKRNKPVLSFSQ